ncbi:MAG TPA: hypothetical protein VGI27_00165, partial [Solirubrobacteraceae bacterium]
LFELLSLCAVDRSKPEQPQRQVSRYLLDHLEHMRGLMRNLVAFEAELWHEGPLRLDTTVYLGVHMRPQTGQQSVLDSALQDLGALNERNDTPRTEQSFDPHRLQVSYGQHGISVATIPDFYKVSNSAMASYLQYQTEWFADGARMRGSNKMPVHGSGEMERLVYGDGQLFPGTNLPKLLTRRAFAPTGNGYQQASQNGQAATANVRAGGAGNGYNGGGFGGGFGNP